MSYIFKRPCAHVRAENWFVAIAIIPIVHPIIDFFLLFSILPLKIDFIQISHHYVFGHWPFLACFGQRIEKMVPYRM